MATKYISSSIMDDLLNTMDFDFYIPVAGELVEGEVIFIDKNKVLVDLGGVATGIISGHEAVDSNNTIKDLKEGDSVSAYVLNDEDEDGLVVLSLRKASQKQTWTKFVEAFENDEIISVKPSEANKGGLLLNIDGIKGFIPVSQLAPLHYPRVNGANSAQILNRLQKLIGVELKVKILNLDKEGGKLILSEKAAESGKRDIAMQKLELGQKVKGKISGIVNFGIFVTFNGLEGLVHISEIAWGHVKDPSDYGKLGDSVEVLVIGKENEKISLSMKRLVPDPWVEAAKKYKVGSIIESVIVRITPFGAFVKLDDDISGLIHISEISDEENPDSEPKLNVGDKVKAKIISIDPDEHRVGLTIKNIDEGDEGDENDEIQENENKDDEKLDGEEKEE